MRTIQSKGQGSTVITEINCLGLLLRSVFSAKHMYQYYGSTPTQLCCMKKKERKIIYNANETEDRACAVKLVWPYCIYYMLLNWWKPCRFTGEELCMQRSWLKKPVCDRAGWGSAIGLCWIGVELDNNASYVDFFFIIIWATWWSGPGCRSSKSSLFIFDDQGLNLPWDVQRRVA